MGAKDLPFAFTQQLPDTAERWLQASPMQGEAWLLEIIVLEKFGEGREGEE